MAKTVNRLIRYEKDRAPCGTAGHSKLPAGVKEWYAREERNVTKAVHGTSHVAPNWANALTALARTEELLEANRHDHLRIQTLESEIRALKAQVQGLVDQKSAAVRIADLGDEHVKLKKEIPILVQPTDDGFIASYFDGSASMTGDTEIEAVNNLKALIVDLFELNEQDEATLGPGLKAQLTAFRKVIERCP